MSTDDILIVGAGGHAKVVLDAIDRSADAARVTVTDADRAKAGTRIAGRIIVAWPDEATLAGMAVHVAIGAGDARARMLRVATDAGARPRSILHPLAAISPSAVVGEASFVAAHAVVGPEARLDVSTIVNHGAIVDHDCIVGAYSHIAPNVTLGGGVRVGAHVLVGAGATILPGVRIGDGALIAAGATIVRDVAPGEKVIFAMIRKDGKAAG